MTETAAAESAKSPNSLTLTESTSSVVQSGSSVTTLCHATELGRRKRCQPELPRRIHSPGEYRSASSRAPACCGPHLAAARPGSCGSRFCVSSSQPFWFTELAISLPVGPAPSVSQPGTDGVIHFLRSRST